MNLIAFAAVAAVLALGAMTPFAASAMTIDDQMIRPAALDADQVIVSALDVPDPAPPVWEMPNLFGASAVIPAYRLIDPGRT